VFSFDRIVYSVVVFQLQVGQVIKIIQFFFEMAFSKNLFVVQINHNFSKSITVFVLSKILVTTFSDFQTGKVEILTSISLLSSFIEYFQS